MTILITGGGGFIGTLAAKRLAARGTRVRILDCHAARPNSLPDGTDYRTGDVRDADDAGGNDDEDDEQEQDELLQG